MRELFYPTQTHLQVSDLCVTEFTASVVAQLHVPLTGQVIHQVWMLLDNGIENVLISQASCKHCNEVLLSYETPQVTPSQFT